MACGCGQSQGGQPCGCETSSGALPLPSDVCPQPPGGPCQIPPRDPSIRALTGNEPQRSLANRLAPLGDRLRQLNTRFGVRPYRVFLNWTLWSGNETGQGYETLKQRIELLPTPLVESLDKLAFSAWHAGVLQVGSFKVSQVSNYAYTEDLLRGFDTCLISNLAGLDLLANNVTVPEPWDFFYEVVEDSRGGPTPDRPRFRLANTPFREPGKLQWTFMLERTDRQRRRNDLSTFGQPGGPR
jgi:hypothetical protein